ncbi:hypothetical protein BDA99DRAFT_524349 [Phascolomyces articulosus]|uniref:PH domain-containing protein n=1 Tax=Phascolomyces articulosus TaxID=60185 RepID=A0AAD5K0F1_9FUNG|nr:hypothetical protein BDA99DRAFT_524349 [Phascolomyces articulosus]
MATTTAATNQQLQRASTMTSTSQALTVTRSKGLEAPVFSASPKRSMSLSRKRTSIVQRQVYRMDGGIHPTELLGTRLNAWRSAIKELIKLFKEIQEIESKTAGGYSKSTKAIVFPIPEASGQFMETGGTQDVWLAFRNYAVEQSVRHQDYVNYLDRSVLPSLRSIKKDIKSMLKAIHQDKNLKTTSLYDGRRRMDALVSKLDSVIQYNMQMPYTAYQRQDPLLINCAVYQANKQLFDSENALHDNILNLQHEVHVFECNLVESIRSITEQLQQFRMEKLESHSAFGQVTSTFGCMNADTEWNEFIRRNAGNLISDDAAYRTDQDICYPNQNHDLVQPVKVGLLERRSGIMRSWVEGLYVLTPSGFLHSYKSTRQFDADPMSPEISIFIPHTSIDCSKNYDSMYQENAFEIKGKNAQSLVGMEKNFMLRAQDQLDLQDWFNKLVQISDRFRPEPVMQPQQQGGYNQQQQPNQTDRALPSMPEEQEPQQQQQQQQQQQYQQQDPSSSTSYQQQQQQPQVIQVPAEYVQPEDEQQQRSMEGAQATTSTQPVSQDISDETQHHHHKDKGKSPALVDQSNDVYREQEDEEEEDDDNWDTVPQHQMGSNKAELQQN